MGGRNQLICKLMVHASLIRLLALRCHVAQLEQQQSSTSLEQVRKEP